MSGRNKSAIHELADATGRRTPLCTKQVVVSSFIGFVATAAACIYSCYRIIQSEKDFHTLQRAQLQSTGSQLMSSIQQQLETSISSTKALSALIHLDEAQKLLEPLKHSIDVLFQKSREFAELPFNTDSGMTQAELEMYNIAKRAKADAAFDIVLNASSLRFNTVADSLIATYEGISNLQLAPGGIVSVIYPLQGHDGMMGHDLFFDPSLREGALEAINRGGIVFVGPVTLTQNGRRAIIARNPTFINRPGFVGPYIGYPSWWGFTAMVCLLDELFAATPLIRSQQTLELSYVLYAKTGEGFKFLKATDDVPDHTEDNGHESSWYKYAMAKGPVLANFSMDDMNVHWNMMMWPRNEWQTHSEVFILQVMLCTFFTICSFVSLYSVLLRDSVIKQVEGILEKHDEQPQQQVWGETSDIVPNSRPRASRIAVMPI